MTHLVQTLGGTLVPLANPQPRHILLPEIARALSRIPRFNGHTLRPWSVAQHSLLVMELLGADEDPELQLAALLHDAHEAYLGDITSPVAAAIRGTRDACPIEGLKTLFNVAIAARFSLDPALFHHKAIQRADAQALALEATHLMAKPSTPWATLAPVPDNPPPLRDMARVTAEATFLRATAELLLARHGLTANALELMPHSAKIEENSEP